MPSIATVLSEKLIVPFIREADFGVREPWFIPERKLFDYLLVYIQEGTCLFHVSGTDYYLNKGDFCLIQPNEYHTLRGVTNTITPFAHFDMFYNPERETSFLPPPGFVDVNSYPHFLQPRLNDYDEIKIPTMFKPQDPVQYREMLMKMIGLWQGNQLIDGLEAQHLAKGIILMLLKEFGQLHTTAVAKPDSLNWITSFLSFRLSEPISVEYMSQRARLSPSRFSAIFRERFGMPPHQYLTNMRIHHAQSLLINRELSISEISDYCGFANVHHFNRVFKRVTGLTPGRYRTNQRNDFIP